MTSDERDLMMDLLNNKLTKTGRETEGEHDISVTMVTEGSKPESKICIYYSHGNQYYTDELKGDYLSEYVPRWVLFSSIFTRHAQYGLLIIFQVEISTS